MLAANEARLSLEKARLAEEANGLVAERQRLVVVKAQIEALRLARPVEIPSGIGRTQVASAHSQQTPPLQSTTRSAVSNEYLPEECPRPARFSAQATRNANQPLAENSRPFSQYRQHLPPVTKREQSVAIEPKGDDDDTSSRMVA